MQRLRTIGQVLGTAARDADRRRGSAWQQPRRRLEQPVHQGVLDFRAWAAGLGLNCQEAAARPGLADRTVRAWAAGAPAAGLASPPGRLVLRSPRAQRPQVLELLDSVGPGLGLPSLQGHFADLPRAELRDLLGRYRRVWVQRHHQALHVRHWQQPGSVWAIDFAEPPQPLEEGFADLLAVRDLASGSQLLWLPVPAATAEETIAVLQMLVTIYGAPLVLKMDNGSPFMAAATQALLAVWQVVPLFSPPGLPAYTGSIEAGIGSLKARTHAQAARQGHPGIWTCADLEAARQAANTLARPQGAHGPTPAEAWAQRRPISVAERAAFRASVDQFVHEGPDVVLPPAAGDPPPEPAAGAGPATPAAAANALEPASAATGASTRSPAQEPPADRAPRGAVGSPQESPAAGYRPARDPAASRRNAISRALVAHGYLQFRRRRIPLPIKRKKAAKIR